MNTLKYEKALSPKYIHSIGIEYDIIISEIKQLYIGADTNSFVYEVKSNDCKKYFMKLRYGDFSISSISIPWFLAEKIGAHIIKPFKTVSGSLYKKNSDHVMILYPYIQGKSGKVLPFSKNQWIKFGKLMSEIHAVKLPPELSDVPCETWNDRWRVQLKEIMQGLNEIGTGNMCDNKYSELLNDNKKVITELLETAEQLAAQIKKQKLNYSLCHADIHAGNILISGETGEFYIVDWDTLMMAPKERDLMFIGGGVANLWNKEEEEAEFYKGYGRYEDVDLSILVYYRCDRIIEDLVVYFNQFFTENVLEENQKAILERVGVAFVSGGVVEMAIKAIRKYERGLCDRS